MIDRQKLLSDVQRLLRSLESDLLHRSESNEVPEIAQALQAEYQKAKNAERTALSYEEWRSDYITQIAAAWVLSCVFARFLEDNRLVDPPKIAGPNERLGRARDEHELYFRNHPTETDREYLLQVFGELARLPGANEVFGRHNLIHELPNWLSGDAAGELLKFFQKIDANTGALVHDFTDPNWDTRFLGDLYQDLSEAARKKYALLQTPEFVEEFILDRTLKPALDEFGLEGFRMIDPACGSGHFLLGSFSLLVERWQKKEPGTNVRVLVQRALDSVHGVDVNPYAIAIARFRLLLAALRECGIHRLQEAPDFHFNLAVGDSLLHGVRGREQQVMHFHELAHHYQSEDLPTLQRILVPGTYHAVVANPPYITPKDKALNEAYRNRYDTCHRQYSLAVPFMERIFGLATSGGFTGQITANSFMKREFGKKLIEEFLPRVDLTHVIDTSGAYIPGHGTPTVILFGRNRPPVGSEVRAVLGIRGEPSTPDVPSQGKVWRSIVEHLDQNGSQNEFVSVADTSRETFRKHPWSIGGGGASDLKVLLEADTLEVLSSKVESIGFGCITKQDEVFAQDYSALLRTGIKRSLIRPFGVGEDLRDWIHNVSLWAIFPYDSEIRTLASDSIPQLLNYMWPWRTTLYDRRVFGGHTYKEVGKPWYEYGQIPPERFRTPLSIAFAFVATHNHFVLDRGGKVFKQSAPVIKLPSDATEDDHLAQLGLLNSSTACFWMKQVFHNKGSTVDEKGARQTTVAFENFYEFTGTGLQQFPVTSEKPLNLAVKLSHLAQEWQRCLPQQLATNFPVSRTRLSEYRVQAATLLGGMISQQEELDWQCYRLYGLVDEDLTYGKEPPPIQLGQRAFEIVMARKMAAGELATTWFERHSSTPITEIPAEWPEDYKRLVERRIEQIETDRNIGLIEQPEYKRRWNTEPWESQLDSALRTWLLDRLESYFDFDGRMNDEGKATAKLDIALVSVGRLADVARQDTDFMQVAELYRNDPAFDVQKLVNELVEAESVPLLPVLRYKESGLRKRAEWEKTWELQREEDRLTQSRQDAKEEEDRLTQSRQDAKEEEDRLTLSRQDAKEEEDRLMLSRQDAKEEKLTLSREDAKKEEELSVSAPLREVPTPLREVSTPLREIPVPPKYTSSDFQSSTYWRLRGKLDVPKERWVSFPHCEGEDGTLMIAWAGYDHLQLARAVSAHYVDVQERLGGRDDPRLAPLLTCLIELLPWLKQWHNEVDPEFGLPMGDYFEGFIQEEARQMGKTVNEIRAWKPSSNKGRQSHAKPRRR
ncbi:MAG: BREX-2 system adenine-specific DNA-methyltransferase PglX [Candidatus Binatia bacterium]